MTLPEGIPGKLLAVGLLILALALIYVAGVRPLQQFYADRQEQIAEKRDRLQRLDRVAAELPSLRRTLTALRDSTRRTQFLLVGSSDTVAAADLQSKVKEIVSQAGAEMTSAESLPPVPRDEFRKVGIRAVVIGDLEMLAAVLRSIQTAHPPLFIDEIAVRNNGISSMANLSRFGYNSGFPNNATSTAKAPERSPLLSIVFNVYGYRASTAKTLEAQ